LITHTGAKLDITMTRTLQRRAIPQLAAKSLIAALVCLPLIPAQAWTLTLRAASRRVFLQVGNGTLNANDANVNRVTVTVPAGQLGSGAAQQMTSNSTQANSPVGNFNLCTPPTQVYVGGSYQRRNSRNGPATARLQVSSPANLTSAAGDVIPFTEISWTTSTRGGDATPNVIPAGTFTGGTQVLTTIPANRYIENCHTFSYANTTARAAGTYDGRVTYTLTTP
jgi:hypothetical protein